MTHAQDKFSLSNPLVGNVFTIKTIDDLKDANEELRIAVRDRGFALIRGCVSRNEARSKLDSIFSYINRTTPYPSSGITKEQVRKNIVKWSIGSTSGSQSGISRLMLTAVNPLYEEDIFDLRSIFTRLICIRDTLAARNPILFDEMLPKPKFNATRLQIYPKGGGFMTAHVDTRAIDNVSDVSDQYIQLVLLLTEKGTDYTNGGAFVEFDGKIIDSEEGGLSGDILVYDGNTRHGVLDVDANKSFDSRDIGGRVVALATVYD